MGMEGILLYCSRAAAVALPVTAVYAGLRLLRLRRRGEGWSRRETVRLLSVLYLALLLAITVVRLGPDWGLLTSNRRTVQLLPLVNTLGELQNGVWAFVYPVAGNMLWFLPLGVLLPLCIPPLDRGWRVLLSAAGLSLCIELSQWLLTTGVADIDDLLFNVAGAMLGYGLLRLYRRLRGRKSPPETPEK